METLKIRVKAKSGKTEIVSKGDVWKVNVKSKAESGKANLEILKFFSKLFKKKVEIVKGKKSRDKILRFFER